MLGSERKRGHTRRHMARLRQVIGTLMRHGFEQPLARMGIASEGSWAVRARLVWQRGFQAAGETREWTTALRDALIELGPAYVKIGQILSVRSDLIPAELAEALKALRSHVPPTPFTGVRALVEAELGGALSTVFSEFEEEPMAAGSIAQVYRARLNDGTPVAVKVKRPGIDAQVIEDLEVLVWLAELSERYLPEARRYRPVASAREVQLYTERELDFRIEGGVVQRLQACYADWPDVVLPRIHRLSRNMVVMDFVTCFAIDDVAALDRYGIDREKLLKTATEAILAQVFKFGLFHGDPHPGNLQVSPEGRLVFLDFGIYGELPDKLRFNSMQSMTYLVQGDIDLAIRYILKTVPNSDEADLVGFQRALSERYRAWLGANTAQYGFAQLFYEEIALGARHGLTFPTEAILMAKALLTLEGVVLALCPQFDLAREAGPFLNRLKWQAFSRKRLEHELARVLPLWLDHAEHLPLLIENYLSRPEARPVAVSAPAQGASVYFPGVALVTGAGLMLGAVPPTWQGMSVVGLLTLLTGMALGLSNRPR